MRELLEGTFWRWGWKSGRFNLVGENGGKKEKEGSVLENNKRRKKETREPLVVKDKRTNGSPRSDSATNRKDPREAKCDPLNRKRGGTKMQTHLGVTRYYIENQIMELYRIQRDVLSAIIETGRDKVGGELPMGSRHPSKTIGTTALPCGKIFTK